VTPLVAMLMSNSIDQYVVENNRP